MSRKGEGKGKIIGIVIDKTIFFTDRRFFDTFHYNDGINYRNNYRIISVNYPLMLSRLSIYGLFSIRGRVWFFNKFRSEKSNRSKRREKFWDAVSFARSVRKSVSWENVKLRIFCLIFGSFNFD